MLKFFFYLHVLGLLMLATGLAWYAMPQETSSSPSMVGVASLIGLGLMFISPYPVIRAMQWMMRQEAGKS